MQKSIYGKIVKKSLFLSVYLDKKMQHLARNLILSEKYAKKYFAGYRDSKKIDNV